MQSLIDTQSSYYYSYFDDIQRVKNYSQLITTEPILRALTERLGFKVKGGISVTQLQDSQIIQITVKNSDVERAALIANGLIEEFIAYYTNLQSERFAESEQSLQAQINQVDGQIKALQAEMYSLSEQTLEEQIENARVHIAELEGQIEPIEAGIETITLKLTPSAVAPPQINSSPTPIPTTKPNRRATATPRLSAEDYAATVVARINAKTPAPTATFTFEQIAFFK